MATLTVEVEDRELSFFKNLLDRFPFVRIKEEMNDEDTDGEVIENIRKGVEEMKLVEEGKLGSRSAREFIKSL